MKVLLVTIVIGKQAYMDTYKRLFQKSQIDYAEKHGYDYKLITDFLDDTYKSHDVSMYFQKSLVCNQSWSGDYDYIIYVDNDVYININSPPIHNYHDFGSKIGVVDEWSQPSIDKKNLISAFWDMPDKSITDYFVNTLSISKEEAASMPLVVNSGVLVFQPAIHRERMNEYYHYYMPRAIGCKFNWFEQASLTLFLVNNDIYFKMDTRYNAVWNWYRSFNELSYLPENLDDFFRQNYFVHFAGKTSYCKIPRLHRVNVPHGEKIADYEPDHILCSLGSIPHMSYALQVVGGHVSTSPFEWILSTPKAVTNSIDDDFVHFLDRVIQTDPFGVCDEDTRNGNCHNTAYMDLVTHKKSHAKGANQYHIDTVEKFRSMLSSPKHKKFFIMSKDNPSDASGFDDFERQILGVTNAIRNHTDNFHVYAYYHITGCNDHYMTIKTHTNVEIRTMHMFSHSDGLRYDDIYDNIWFKNTLNDNIQHS